MVENFAPLTEPFCVAFSFSSPIRKFSDSPNLEPSDCCVLQVRHRLLICTSHNPHLKKPEKPLKQHLKAVVLVAISVFSVCVLMNFTPWAEHHINTCSVTLAKKTQECLFSSLYTTTRTHSQILWCRLPRLVLNPLRVQCSRKPSPLFSVAFSLCRIAWKANQIQLRVCKCVCVCEQHCVKPRQCLIDFTQRSTVFQPDCSMVGFKNLYSWRRITANPSLCWI